MTLGRDGHSDRAGTPVQGRATGSRRAILLAGLLLPFLASPAAPTASAQDAPAPTKVAPASFFKGKVASLDGRRIELSYDFADPAQAADWIHTHPFVRPATTGGWRVEQGALRGDGNAGWRHRATFDGEVTLKGMVSSEDARNFGALVLDEERSTFTIFALADATFTLLDRRAPLEHMITTFKDAGQGPGGSTEWRYVQTAYEPKIGSGEIEITVRKKGPQNDFLFAGTGRLSGKDVEATVGPKLAPAFYTLGSRVVIRRVTVAGVLDAAWLRKNDIAFEDRVPEDPNAPPPDAAPTDAKGRPGGGDAATEWVELVRKIADRSLSREEREGAADALTELKEKRAVRYLIDVLYDDDDETGREVAHKAFKGIVGKDGGYRYNAPREFRLKAMPRVWEYWYSLRELIEKEEKKARDKDK